MVEAILSITLLSLLIVVLYLNAYPTTIQNVEFSQEQVYEYLAASDDAGFLRPAVYYRTSANLAALEDFLYCIIPGGVLFRILVDSSPLAIGSYQSPSSGQVSASYWLSGYNAEPQYNTDYLVSLELWQQEETQI